jgi:hypothetical protein
VCISKNSAHSQLSKNKEGAVGTMQAQLHNHGNHEGLNLVTAIEFARFFLFDRRPGDVRPRHLPGGETRKL